MDGSSRLAAGGLLTWWGPDWANQTPAWVGCGREGMAVPGGQGPRPVHYLHNLSALSGGPEGALGTLASLPLDRKLSLTF